MQLTSLPAFHRDPFDRMLICQVLENSLVIATLDAILDAAVRAYPVSVL